MTSDNLMESFVKKMVLPILRWVVLPILRRAARPLAAALRAGMSAAAWGQAALRHGLNRFTAADGRVPSLQGFCTMQQISNYR